MRCYYEKVYLLNQYSPSLSLKPSYHMYISEMVGNQQMKYISWAVLEMNMYRLNYPEI